MFNRAFFTILLLSPGYVFAAPVKTAVVPTLPVRESAQYKLSWLGLPFGTATINWQEDETSYHADFTLRTNGVAAVFKPQEMEAELDGHRQVEGTLATFTPTRYRFDNRAKKKTTSIGYDAAGNVAALDTGPNDNEDDDGARRAVSQAGQDGGIDPLSVLAAFAAYASEGSTHAAVTEFDGLRLMTLRANLVPNDAKTPPTSRTYRFTRQPLEGFTAKELAHVKKDAALSAIVRPGISRLPDEIEAKVLLGTVKIDRVP